MRLVVRVILALLLMVVAAIAVAAQSTANEPGSASISGRITDSNGPLAGIAVVLLPAEFRQAPEPLARAVTDSDGRYTFTAVKAGSYRVSPLTTLYAVNNEAGVGQPGKLVTLKSGEAAEEIDFLLPRGGVITGLVTDANDEPLINVPISLIQIGEGGQKRRVSMPDVADMCTDDRGIYRLFGLPPGRYLVSIGQNAYAAFEPSQPVYERTYHPGTTVESEASIVELTAAGEVTGIDIVVGNRAPRYAASGRIVDVATGKPIPDIRFGFGPVNADGIFNRFAVGFRTDARGDFQLSNLAPGRYGLFIRPDRSSNYFCEPFHFEVKNSDVTGLAVKAQLGGTISGQLIVEGSNESDVTQRLSQLELFAREEASQTQPLSAQARIDADGSFFVGGLPEGQINFFLFPFRSKSRFFIARVEHNGSEQPQGIRLAPGEQVRGVRIVLLYGNSSVRGAVKVVGGTLSDYSGLLLVINPLQKDRTLRLGPPTRIDSRGAFIFEGLPAGEYELSIHGQANGKTIRPVSEKVIVGYGTESDIVLTLDIGQGE